MYYEDSIVEEVRTKNDIVDVIGSYVKLTKKGANHMGLCPFHGEKTPSFSVSQSKQMYRCFGCGVGGNVFTFLMEYENYTFVEALRVLAERAGIELPQKEQSEEAKKSHEQKNKLLEANRLAARYYYAILRSDRGQGAMEYLRNRELTDETMQHFGLGYSDKFGGGLYKYLKKEGYSDEFLKLTGLVNIDEQKGGSDKFWNRVMFPIMDINNKVIAFGGRVMGDGTPKYLNSPETKLFDKSRNLYGLNFARTSRKSYFLLCEGYMDVIALHQAGFTNAVASLGTAFTGLHANLMSRYVKEVILTYDSDEAGTKAALRAIPILKESGISARVINMKPYKDPDEFIKALGADEYQKRIEQAVSSFFFEIAVLEQQYDMQDPEQKTRFYNEIAGKLAGFPEEIERNNYMEAIDRIYHMGYENLRHLVNSIGSRKLSQQIAQETKERDREAGKKKGKPEEGIFQSQKMLLTWIAEEPKVYDKINSIISAEDFTEEPYKSVAQMVFEQYEKEKMITPARIIGRFESIEEQAKVAELFSASVREELSEQERNKAFSDTVVRIRKNSLECAGKKAIEENNVAEYQRIIKQMSELSRLTISLR